MFHQPTLVSKDFYMTVKKILPEALSEARYARFLDYLLFGEFRDIDSGYRVCPEELLADMEDLGHKLKGNSRNYNRARLFPLEFQDATGLALLSRPYRYSDRKASAYEFQNLPEELELAWRREKLSLVRSFQEGVFLDTGKPLEKQYEMKKREKFIARKLAYMEEGTDRADVQYLNQSSRTSTFLDRKKAERLERVLTAVAKITDTEKRNFAIRRLEWLPTYEPFYVESLHTQRIYTAGTSMQNFSESIRAAILRPSKNYDLTAAQLAIMGTHWDVPEIQDLVVSGQVWEKFCMSLGIPVGLKQDAKRLVYSTAFGMTETNLAIRYGQTLGELSSEANRDNTSAETIQHYLERLWSNPYLGALLEGRKRAMKRIQKERRAVDAQGQARWTKDFGTSWEGGKKGRTMMAFEMQSREMWLMEPVIEMAQENEGKMLITLWLHDGVYIHYHKADRSKKLEREMMRRVNERAREAGYPTTLELVRKAA